MLNVVPTSISIAHPANNIHGNTDDSDIKPDMIAATPPPTEVSTLLVVCPITETVPGQSPAQREPTEPAIAPPAIPPRVQVSVSKLLEMKAARLAQQAQWLNQKAQAGLPPSNDEVCPTTHPTWEELSALKERS